MQNPTPLKNSPPKLRSKIIKLAKRLAFIESNMFTRIFRLDGHIAHIKTFLAREDVAPEARSDAEKMQLDLSDQDLGM